MKKSFSTIDRFTETERGIVNRGLYNFITNETEPMETFDVGKNYDADLECHILSSTGEIQYKILNEKREIVQYLYHDSSDSIVNVAKLFTKKIKNDYKNDRSYKDKLNNKDFIYLVDLRDLKEEINTKTSILFDFEIKSSEKRYYLNDVSMASLIGSMMDCSFTDITFSGFSTIEGGPGTESKSHKNGMNGDIRYLRSDKSGGIVYLNKKEIKSFDKAISGWSGIDIERQNKLNNALYKYGWKSMLSYKFNNYLLERCIHDENHFNHLHIQNYTPKLKLIVPYK